MVGPLSSFSVVNGSGRTLPNVYGRVPPRLAHRSPNRFGAFAWTRRMQTRQVRDGRPRRLSSTTPAASTAAIATAIAPARSAALGPPPPAEVASGPNDSPRNTWSVVAAVLFVDTRIWQS